MKRSVRFLSILFTTEDAITIKQSINVDNRVFGVQSKQYPFILEKNLI